MTTNQFLTENVAGLLSADFDADAVASKALRDAMSKAGWCFELHTLIVDNDDGKPEVWYWARFFKKGDGTNTRYNDTNEERAIAIAAQIAITEGSEKSDERVA